MAETVSSLKRVMHTVGETHRLVEPYIHNLEINNFLIEKKQNKFNKPRANSITPQAHHAKLLPLNNATGSNNNVFMKTTKRVSTDQGFEQTIQ